MSMNRCSPNSFWLDINLNVSTPCCSSFWAFSSPQRPASHPEDCVRLGDGPGAAQRSCPPRRKGSQGRLRHQGPAAGSGAVQHAGPILSIMRSVWIRSFPFLLPNQSGLIRLMKVSESLQCRSLKIGSAVRHLSLNHWRSRSLKNNTEPQHP